jgi:hypothetical protein
MPARLPCPGHTAGRAATRGHTGDARHRNLWTETLGLAEARPPSYFRSVTRLKTTSQVELFE